MRKSSQVLMGAVSLVTLASGFQVGASAKSTGFTPNIPTTTTTPTPNPGTSTTPTSNPTPTKSSGGGKTSTPSPTKTSTPTPTKTTPPVTTTVSHESSPVYYRFGTVQLTVTKQGSTITDIVMNQAGATNGRAAAFPYLIQLAKAAQSATFDTSMMGGATYSTNAFMQALGDALSQF